MGHKRNPIVPVLKRQKNLCSSFQDLQIPLLYIYVTKEEKHGGEGGLTLKSIKPCHLHVYWADMGESTCTLLNRSCQEVDFTPNWLEACLCEPGPNLQRQKVSVTVCHFQGCCLCFKIQVPPFQVLTWDREWLMIQLAVWAEFLAEPVQYISICQD